MLGTRKTSGPGDYFNVDVENVVRNIDTVGLKNPNPIGSHREIPKGYELIGVLGDARQQDIIARLEAAENRRLEAVDGSKSTTKRKRFHFGFDPSKMLASHAIHSPPDFPFKTNTLTNPIHPVFAYERFYEMPQDIYDIISPALRLATQWLTHPAAATFWHNLAFGHREKLTDLPLHEGHFHERIRADVPYTQAHAEEFDRYLIDVHRNHRVEFTDQLKSLDVYAYCWFSPENRARIKLPLDTVRRMRSQIYVHQDFYTTATKLKQLKNGDPDMILRYYFLLSIAFCHEMAHSFENRKNGPDPKLT